MDYNRKALTLHKKLAGKIVISSKIPVKNKDVLSTVYTPGVGAVSRAIAKNKDLSWDYTGRGNSVAIVSDGTAVLGLGNVGPEAGMPVMEGKSVLFAEFGQINAYPLCISVDKPQDIVNFIKVIAPSFGGINMEDIAAPSCFEVEEQLQDLGIPVFHDDQDGTAIVVLAALVNATRVLGKNLGKMRVVIFGAGAAGAATAWLLSGREKWKAQKKIAGLFFDTPLDIIVLDSKGIIEERRPNLTTWKKILASVTNKEKHQGELETALRGADVFIGLSSGGKLTPSQIALMNKSPIIFALSNPNPEIMPDLAQKTGAAFVATGRSDFPNQVNNALVFPGMFRGLLDARATKVTPQVKLAAAKALAESVSPTKTAILPSVLATQVHKKLALAVSKAARL